jgi:hypothetical protein
MRRKKNKVKRLSFTAFIIPALICFATLLQAGDADAVTHVYYTDQDTGTAVATGITTDWGSCANDTGVITLALQDTSVRGLV